MSRRGSLGAGLAAAVLAGCAGGEASRERATELPRPPAPALRIPPPAALERGTAEWAPVARAVTALRGPREGAGVVAALATRTPEGTATTVPILDRGRGRGGRLWLRVRLPVLPNGTTGWVPRRALGGLHTVRTHLVVDLRRLRATLERDGRAVFSAPIGVGEAAWPTPRGRFHVRNRLTRYRSPTYGPIAFGTSARSPTATDWPAGGFVGIHGTDRPELLPGRVSHGCIRVRNAAIRRLVRLMPIGTPVHIR